METRIVGIDFESTFSSEHTLTTMSIEAYARHPKFEVIGCGIRDFQTGESSFVTGADIKPALAAIVDASWVAHHSQFDGFIANSVYNVRPKFWYDTLSMSRAIYQNQKKHSLDHLASTLALGTPKTVPYGKFRGKSLVDLAIDLIEEIGRGCEHDLSLTHALFQHLLPFMPEKELKLIDANVRLFTEPVLLGDVALLQEAVDDAVAARTTKRDAMGLTDAVLRSDAKFATLLRGAGCTPPTKISPRTGKEAFAFAKGDEAFLALKEHPDERVRDLVEARIAVKTSIHETRAGRLLSAAQRGSIPVYLKYYGAHTGRFSGGDKINLQNLPRGSKLRGGLLAPPGCTLVWGDLSQIECRLTAWLAGCETLLGAFREGRDVYSEFGTAAFGTEVSKTVNPELRFFAKTTVLGAGYGLGKERFAHFLKIQGKQIDRMTSDLLIDKFREVYREIPQLWRHLDKVLAMMARVPDWEGNLNPCWVSGKKIILPNGMWLDYTQQDFEKIWGGALTENCLSAETKVLTPRRWCSIVDVRPDDLVWDGEDWVAHEGVIARGERETRPLDGVWMTDDHEVLTDHGWIRAALAQGLHRHAVRAPNGASGCRERREASDVAGAVRLREHGHAARQGASKTRVLFPKLRAIEALTARAASYARTIVAPRLPCLALNASEVREPQSQSLEKLRRPWDHGLPGLGFIRRFLGRHGEHLQRGVDPGEAKQRAGIQQEKLLLGDLPTANAEHPEDPSYSYPLGVNVHWGSRAPFGHWGDDTALPVGGRVADGSDFYSARRREQTYDIRNCGPRHRFVVLGDKAPFIVHNCIQALARIVVTDAWLTVKHEFVNLPESRVALMVHDELVCCVPLKHRDEALTVLGAALTQPVSWAPDLPLACELYYGQRYDKGECKPITITGA